MTEAPTQKRPRRPRSPKLPPAEERQARLLANPANFGEMVLGYQLYPKQRRALEAIVPAGSSVSVSCCNEGGKSSRIIPTAVLWHQSLFPAGICKVMSASWTQIEDQVWPSIVRHKDLFPGFKWLETPFFTSKRDDGREGFFRGFTTDTPGRAEGDHADGEDVPLLFIVDEAKSCPIWLRGVIEGRVRPTRLLLLSSHGFSEGWFYESQTILKDNYTTVHITAEDCPHISPETIAEVKKKFAGFPEFADSVLGYGFLPLIQDAVIDAKALEENLGSPPAKNPNGDTHAFCDFAWSGSGDENVLALRRGNIITIEATFYCGHLCSSQKNPGPGIVEQFIHHFVRLGLNPQQISGDSAGGGQLVIQALESRGWFINAVNNGESASDSEHYANIGAEMWYEGGKAIVERRFVLPHDQILRGQLLNRKRVPNKKGKLAVEFKEDMRRRGVNSPDRADAVLGCMMPSGGFTSEAISWAMALPVGKPYEAVRAPE